MVENKKIGVRVRKVYVYINGWFEPILPLFLTWLVCKFKLLIPMVYLPPPPPPPVLIAKLW